MCGEKRLRKSESNINELPDDILVNILSFLDMKEAAGTSILSHKWKDLWTYSTCLRFANVDENGFRKGSNLKYLRWVNHVLDVHKGSPVEMLRIVFDSFYSWEYPANVQNSLDNLVDFAIRKRVQYLQLDLDHYCGSDLMPHVSPYQFPAWLLDMPAETPVFDRLRFLSMMSVSISGEELQRLVSTCARLEELVISNSSQLHQVKVIAPKLIRLEIRGCSNLSSIDIVSAPNLRFFKHKGVENGEAVSFSFKDSPELCSVYLGGTFCQEAFLSELRTEKLELEMYEVCRDHGCRENPTRFTQFRHVKQLKLNFIFCPDEYLISGIADCTCLEKLTLKYGTRFDTGPLVEFAGWSVPKYEVELADYVMDIAANNLQKFTFLVPNRPNPQMAWVRKDDHQKDSEAAILSAEELIRKSQMYRTSNARFEITRI